MLNFKCLTVCICLLVLLSVRPDLQAQEVSDDFIEAYRAYDKAYQEGDLNKAFEMAIKALEMGREELGPDHEKTSVLEINLAHLLTVAGQFKEAESLFVNARKTLEMQKEADAPVFETIYTDLGQIYTLEGRFDEARSNYLKAIRVVAKEKGAEDPYVAELLLKQGAAEFGAGDMDAAHRALQRALDIRKAAFGARDVRTADVVYQQGVLVRNENKHDDAKKLFQSALLIYEQTLKREDPRILAVHRQMAVVAEATGNPEEFDYHSDKVVSLTADTEGAAQALILVQPKYPELPEDAPRDGWVLLEYTVTEKGRVTNPQVIEGENQQLFAKAAIAGTRKWRFKPRVQDGKRVAQTGMRARIEFTPDNVEISVGTVE